MKKVIVIDDSLVVRRHVAQLLREAGYAVVEAEDGLDGLEKIDANGDVGMILCDLNMPRMGGLDLLASLAARGTRLPPFLMLTTEAQPSLVHRAKESGARGWIIKPFKPLMLLAAVQRLLPAA